MILVNIISTALKFQGSNKEFSYFLQLIHKKNFLLVSFGYMYYVIRTLKFKQVFEKIKKSHK